MKCKSCGAELIGYKCEYCGTISDKAKESQMELGELYQNIEKLKRESEVSIMLNMPVDSNTIINAVERYQRRYTNYDR